MTFLFSFFSRFRWNRLLLLLGSAFASVVCIALENRGLLPLDVVTFLFFSFVAFLMALYRPGWVFLLFIGVLPLETINLAPAVWGGSMLRPYQWLAFILLLAVFLRCLVKRLPFRLFRPQWFDALPICIALGAFMALINAPIFGVSLKQALVVTSFVAVYFLGRIFLRTLYDVRQALPFFLVSSVVVFGYALWQNIRFLVGQESFQVMVGRPNATFAEADWLGMFTLLSLGVGMALLTRLLFRSGDTGRTSGNKRVAKIGLFATACFLILNLVILILTVARSAWLGAVTLIILFVSWFALTSWQESREMRSTAARLGKALALCGVLGCLSLVAIGIVSSFHLSPFQLLNRIESTGSGLQKITVACQEDVVLPDKITDTSELASYHCRHIDLEAIVAEKEAGQHVKEVLRDDPNIALRKSIYEEVWQVGMKYPIVGIGWGSAASVLGTDERGASLNASNMFLEVWLGSGLLGLCAFVLWWGIVLSRAFRQSLYGRGEEVRLFATFVAATLSGLTVFNLFNAGLLLGFFFLFLSVAALVMEITDEP